MNGDFDISVQHFITHIPYVQGLKKNPAFWFNYFWTITVETIRFVTSKLNLKYYFLKELSVFDDIIIFGLVFQLTFSLKNKKF